MKRLVILAGPNGAGKTTLAMVFGATGHIATEDILNPDRFTKPLVDANPSDTPDEIRLKLYEEMERQREARFARGKSYALETNFTHPDKIELLQAAHAKGYETLLMFIALSSPELAIQRVALRVSRGGHHVDDDRVRRRWSGGLKALASAIPIVDVVTVFDNSMDYPEGSVPKEAVTPVFTFADGKLVKIGNSVPPYLLGWLAYHRPDDVAELLPNPSTPAP